MSKERCTKGEKEREKEGGEWYRLSDKWNGKLQPRKNKQRNRERPKRG